MYFQGMFDGAIWASMAIILLDFVSTTTAYGSFVSAFALFGAVAALVLARISDKVKERRTFLILGLAILVPATAIGAVWHDVLGFSVAMVLINFSAPIAGVFLFAIAGDAAASRPHDVAFLREILLNAGRVTSAAIVLLLVLAGFPANLSFGLMLAASLGMAIAK
jgi:MFS family permease